MFGGVASLALVGSLLLFAMLAGAPVTSPYVQPSGRSALWHRGPLSYELRPVSSGLQVVVFTAAASGDRVSVIADADPVPEDGAVAIALGRPQEETGPCCGFFFGTAPRFASNVVIRAHGKEYSAGVANRLWLIVAPLTRLDPSSVEWAFLTSTGAVIAQGHGSMLRGLDHRDVRQREGDSPAGTSGGVPSP